MIAKPKPNGARNDMHLYINGKQVDWALSYTTTSQWNDLMNHWVGTLNAGDVKIGLKGNVGGVWGCGPTWGDIDVITWQANPTPKPTPAPPPAPTPKPPPAPTPAPT